MRQSKRGDESCHALLRNHDGRRTRPPARPRPARQARGVRRTGPPRRTTFATPLSRAGVVRAASRSRTPAGGSPGTRAGPPSRRGPSPRRGTRSSTTRPDLVPVDERRKPLRRRRGQPPEARSTETTRCARRRSGRRCRPGGEARPRRTDRWPDAATPVGLVEIASRRYRTTRTPGVGLFPPAPLPPRDVCDLVPGYASVRPGCGTSARRLRSCTGTGSRRRCRRARGISFQPVGATAASAQQQPEPRVSIVIPCLNEAATIAECVTSARTVLEENGYAGEVIVVDNGSDDGSGDIARGGRGERRPRAPPGIRQRIPGRARAARGEYVVMADADLTYDFREIPAFVHELDAGAQLVMGNRLKGIQPGAMPWLSRVGNPILSGFLNLLYKTNIADVHCGMRAMRRDVLPMLDLRSTGMEFASEMVIRAAREKLDVREIPIELHPRVGTVEALSIPRRLAPPAPDPRLPPELPVHDPRRGPHRSRLPHRPRWSSPECRSSTGSCTRTR